MGASGGIHDVRRPERPLEWTLTNRDKKRVSLTGFLSLGAESKATVTAHWRLCERRASIAHRWAISCRTL